MKKVGFLPLFLIMLFFGLQAQGQTLPVSEISNKLARIHDQYPLEKIHLHMDKPYYSIGDTMWFKAYVVNADENVPSTIGTVLYVDLINDNGKLAVSLKLPLSVGTAAGDIVLSDTLAEGTYHIRAYTNWMRNFGEDFFFHKSIPVGNALRNKVITKTAFTFSTVGANETTSADIQYLTFDGMPISSKEVSYAVQFDERTIEKGKGITDALGHLKISFSNSSSPVKKTGQINTALKMDDKTTVNKIIPVKSTLGNVAVQFFPEGGELVNKITSKIAFKALSSDGLGIGISGYIEDQDHNKITEFHTEHAGMGAFVLTPLPDRSYTAVIITPDGSDKRIELPKAQNSGYVMSIDNSDPTVVKVKISVSPEILAAGANITLIAQSNNLERYLSATQLKALTLNASISRKKLSEGVTQFTLFAGDKPVAERLVFIDHTDEHLNIDVKTDHESYTRRQKVMMDIEVKDLTTEKSFSVAVTNMNKVPVNEDAEITIFSSLLLSSDLKGYIENPNYYFTNSDMVKAMQLDNLMLTQGWRKFDQMVIEWKQILSDSLIKPIFQPEKGISISGRMIASGTKKPVSKGKVMLLMPNGGLPLDTLTDENGRFNFDNLVFADNAKLVVQAVNAKDKNNVIIEIDKTLPQQVTIDNNEPNVVNTDIAMITYLKSSYDHFEEMQKYGMLKKTDIQLKEVQINAKGTKVFGNKEIVENSSNLNLPGHYDYLLKSKDIEKYQNIGWSLAALPGISIREDPYTHKTTASSGRAPLGGSMRVYLDGVDIGEDFSIVTASDVASIEVLVGGSNVAIYGNTGVRGVIVITTKRGNEKQEPVPNYNAPHISTFQSNGYSITREFYSPVYTPEKTSPMADLRTTIYWNPEVIIGKQGKTSLEFFTADEPGTYRAVIEGLDYSGRLGRKTFTFTVK
jgi:hypothetical protein